MTGTFALVDGMSARIVRQYRRSFVASAWISRAASGIAIIGPNGAGKTTLLQPDQRALPRLHRGNPAERSPASTACRRTSINRMGLSRSFQITSIFHRLSVFENLRCALLWSMGYRYSFWSPLWRQRELTERTDAMLEDLNLAPRRDIPAGLLSYAEQRALEIGMTIAGRLPR